MFPEKQNDHQTINNNSGNSNSAVHLTAQQHQHLGRTAAAATADPFRRHEAFRRRPADPFRHHPDGLNLDSLLRDLSLDPFYLAGPRTFETAAAGADSRRRRHESSLADRIGASFGNEMSSVFRGGGGIGDSFFGMPSFVKFGGFGPLLPGGSGGEGGNLPHHRRHHAAATAAAAGHKQRLKKSKSTSDNPKCSFR